MEGTKTRLVVTRTPGQSVAIYGPAEITIEHVRGNRCSVSIVAAAETKILRTELVGTDREPKPGLGSRATRTVSRAQ